MFEAYSVSRYRRAGASIQPLHFSAKWVERRWNKMSAGITSAWSCILENFNHPSNYIARPRFSVASIFHTAPGIHKALQEVRHEFIPDDSDFSNRCCTLGLANTDAQGKQAMQEETVGCCDVSRNQSNARLALPMCKQGRYGSHAWTPLPLLVDACPCHSLFSKLLLPANYQLWPSKGRQVPSKIRCLP
jgi:hypothetical protein